VSESATALAPVATRRRSLIEVRNVSKTFGANHPERENVEIIRDFNLELEEGKLVTVFGPNGSGKSTILHMLAGILKPDAGEIVRHSAGPEAMPVGYVFQNHADTLLPWRTVRDNLAFPLEIRKVPLEEQVSRINRRLEQFQLAEHANKYVYQLSGGLKQLVSIARATVYDPQLLILDEPFSALDYSLCRMLWLRFREFWAHQNVTTVFVSHNVDEAVFLGDRVIVLSARPAKVVADVEVPLGQERSLSLLSSEKFFELRNQVLAAFEKGKQA
jgi:NitT/TauT family transport system ATP-binding protein